MFEQHPFSTKGIALIQLCPKVMLKVPITYIAIPILDKRFLPKKGRRVQQKYWGKGNRRKRQAKKTGPVKRCNAKPVIVNVQWPVLNPYLVFSELIRAEAFTLLAADGWDWCDFWQTAAASEDWMESHPVLNEPASVQAHAVGATWHGDEGQGKRSKNLLVLSWSSIAVSGKSELTKFPFAVS